MKRTLIVVAALAVFAFATPAGAAEGQTVSVTPTSRLVDGQQVDVAFSGWPEHAVYVMQCWRDPILTPSPDLTWDFSACISIGLYGWEGESSGVYPVTRYMETWNDTATRVDCAKTPSCTLEVFAVRSISVPWGTAPDLDMDVQISVPLRFAHTSPAYACRDWDPEWFWPPTYRDCVRIYRNWSESI